MNTKKVNALPMLVLAWIEIHRGDLVNEFSVRALAALAVSWPDFLLVRS